MRELEIISVKSAKKGFYRKSHLEGHMRTHTGDRPFMCKICDQKFAH